MNAVSNNQVANANSNNVVVIDSLHGALHQGQLMNHHHHGMTMPLHQQFQVQGDPQQLDLNSYHATNAQQQQGAIDSQGNVMTPFDIQVCFILYYICTNNFSSRYTVKKMLYLHIMYCHCFTNIQHKILCLIEILSCC